MIVNTFRQVNFKLFKRFLVKTALSLVLMAGMFMPAHADNVATFRQGQSANLDFPAHFSINQDGRGGSLSSLQFTIREGNDEYSRAITPV